MNTRTANAPEWPITTDRDAAGRATVTLADGVPRELDAFRDDCRALAVELRREAMDDASRTMAAVLRRAAGAVWRLLSAPRDWGQMPMNRY